MNIGTAEKSPRVVLDTNIVVSALIYGGKPEEIYNLVLNKQIFAVISSILLAELIETLVKKFSFSLDRIKQLEKITKRNFQIIHPEKTIKLLHDEDDDRVLEAALQGNCDYIITGDKELLKLRIFQNIQIVTAGEFLSIL